MLLDRTCQMALGDFHIQISSNSHLVSQPLFLTGAKYFINSNVDAPSTRLRFPLIKRSSFLWMAVFSGIRSVIGSIFILRLRAFNILLLIPATIKFEVLPARYYFP